MISQIPSPTYPNRLANGHPRDTDLHFLDSRSLGEGVCSMKFSEDVHQYTAEKVIAPEEAFQRGMEKKSKEFIEAGAEVYAKV